MEITPFAAVRVAVDDGNNHVALEVLLLNEGLVNLTDRLRKRIMTDSAACPSCTFTGIGH